MRNIYRETFDQIHASETLRKEVLEMTKQQQSTVRRRRIPKGALIAAALVLVLAGTTLAAVGMPRTLRDWFAMEWQERTDKDISLEQLAVIDHLTQTVGVSDTQNGTTVTLDSVTVGNSSMWMMLKVSGTYSENEALRYHFDKIDITLTPDPDQQTNTPRRSTAYLFPWKSSSWHDAPERKMRRIFIRRRNISGYGMWQTAVPLICWTMTVRWNRSLIPQSRCLVKMGSFWGLRIRIRPIW